MSRPPFESPGRLAYTCILADVLDSSILEKRHKLSHAALNIFFVKRSSWLETSDCDRNKISPDRQPINSLNHSLQSAPGSVLSVILRSIP